MFVRLTHFNIPEDQIDSIKTIYYSEIAPVISQQPGLVNVFLLEPLEVGDDFISCSIWHNETDTRAFESSASYPEVFAKIKAIATKPPMQKYYMAESSSQ